MTGCCSSARQASARRPMRAPCTSTRDARGRLSRSIARRCRPRVSKDQLFGAGGDASGGSLASADGGTLLLDEIGELPDSAQTRISGSWRDGASMVRVTSMCASSRPPAPWARRALGRAGTVRCAPTCWRAWARTHPNPAVAASPGGYRQPDCPRRCRRSARDRHRGVPGALSLRLAAERRRAGGVHQAGVDALPRRPPSPRAPARGGERVVDARRAGVRGAADAACGARDAASSSVCSASTVATSPAWRAPWTASGTWSGGGSSGTSFTRLDFVGKNGRRLSETQEEGESNT